ncbi:MAG: glycosyltransferase family 39 protein [Acidobacteriota bacterium]|nr:glycosyltransferase family 39 protein [Acidobacteriota bacterium]
MNQTEQKQSETARKKKNFLFRAVVCLLFAAFVFQLWFHAARTSATVDEVQHIFAGHRHWQCADFAINPEHPPLLKLLAASPLIFRTLNEPPIWECGTRPTSKTDASLAGFSFLARNNTDSIVIPTRLAASVLSLLLAVLVFLAALGMFGRFEALVALALLAFEPNIIAHGSLVTTDIAVSVGFFAAVYVLYRYRKKPSLIRFLALGSTIGLTLAAKHSGILVIPILFLLLFSDLLLFRRFENETPLQRKIIRDVAAFAGAVLIGVVLLWACYGFNARALPGSGEETILQEVFPTQTPEGKQPSVFRRTLKTMTGVFPESYTVGLADVVSSSSRPMFLLGEVYPAGRWFYFPVAFSIKTSLALLVLLAAGLFSVRLYRERGREMLYLLLPSLAFFGISLASKMNIGVRHILPVYAFFIVVAAAGGCALSRKHKIARWALILLLVAHAATAFRTAPNYLAFSNILWGGTNNTYRLLADSNVEWGQNLKLVNEYLIAEKIEDCWFANFGGGELARRNVPCRLMPGGYAWNATEEPVEPIPSIVEGTILLSVALLPPVGGNEYLPVIANEPVAQIGGSIFVYRGRFELQLASALSYVARAEHIARLNRFEEAVDDARTAIKLVPDDARMHLALGTVLKGANQKDEAKRELETAIRLAQSNPAIFGQTEMRARAELAELNINKNALNDR